VPTKIRKFEAVSMGLLDRYMVVEVDGPVGPDGRLRPVAYAVDAEAAAMEARAWNARAAAAPCASAETPRFLVDDGLGRVHARMLLTEPETAIVRMAGGLMVTMRQDAVADFLAYWGTVPGLVLPGPTCERCDARKVPGTFCVGEDECLHGPSGTAAERCDGWGRRCCRCGSSYAIGQM